jgi:hypothetical protein
MMRLNTKLLLTVYLTFASILNVSGQDGFIESEAFMTTAFNGNQLNAKSDNAIVVVQESADVIKVRVNFDSFSTGSDSLDQWFSSLRGKFFWYSGTLPAESILALNQENTSEFESSGKLGFSDRVNTDVTVPMAALKLAGTQGLLQGINSWSDIRISCTFNIDPVAMGIKLKDQPLTEPVSIVIRVGRINPYVFGQPDITK